MLIAFVNNCGRAGLYLAVSRCAFLFLRIGNELRARASEASSAREALSRAPDSNQLFYIHFRICVGNPSNLCFERTSAKAYL